MFPFIVETGWGTLLRQRVDIRFSETTGLALEQVVGSLIFLPRSGMVLLQRERVGVLVSTTLVCRLITFSCSSNSILFGDSVSGASGCLC